MSESLLTVTDLVKRFGGVSALDGCSLKVAKGNITGLIGPNGSGKTTLFNLICGLDTPDAGRIVFRGERLDRRRPHEIARLGVGRTFQLIQVFPELTSLDNMMAAARGGSWGQSRARAFELLAFVNLTQLRGERAGNLSFGQQKLLEFARMLMSDPGLLLLDEPAAGVNRVLLERLLDHIQALREQGKTIVIVEHDMNVVMNLCEWVCVMDQGRLLLEGPPEVVREDPRVIEAYFGR
ncbi:MAG: ABC transporter ATP-binding protein [Candidatus Rokubacteria bacterium]|nr:ABC transporter ATP-binding protein [Candidatus Rokubacteria bacterium]